MTDKPAASTDESWTDPSMETDADVAEEEFGDPGLETPVEDAVEQAQEAVRAHADTVGRLDLPTEVDPADLAEQNREVPDDDDEYR